MFDDFILDTPEIKFPSLEDLTIEFSEKNNLSLREITPYNYPSAEIFSNGSYSSGLILEFKEGIAVLSQRGNIEDSWRLKNSFGAKQPVLSWEIIYGLSGRLNQNEIGLSAMMVYTKGTKKQKIPSPRCSSLRERVEYLPTNEVTKQIYRKDNSPFWFLCDAKK